MPPVIEVTDLVKRYRKADRNALEGVSLDVAAGSFYALLGPNGAGKTTLVSILTTMLTPSSGTALVAGHDVARAPAAVRKNIGVIFQRPSLDLNLTAEENVRLHAVLYGLYPMRPAARLMPANYRDQVAELAAVVGLTGEMHRPVRTFSGGMRRKLEVVRSLIHRPRVLFLDEPTTGLDPASRRNLWAYLREVRRLGDITVFLTTHYLEEAEDADQICVINQGEVVTSGTPAQVKASLVDRYVAIDADDRSALQVELQRMGVPFAPEPGEEGFRIILDGKAIHPFLKSIETPLTAVRTHTPSLEEAYLKLIAVPEE